MLGMRIPWGIRKKGALPAVPGCDSTPLLCICYLPENDAGCLAPALFLYVAYYSLRFTKVRIANQFIFSLEDTAFPSGFSCGLQTARSASPPLLYAVAIKRTGCHSFFFFRVSIITMNRQMVTPRRDILSPSKSISPCRKAHRCGFL